jgi:hypothetical protein
MFYIVTAMPQRVVLHSDMNNFYASVECVYNPALCGKPVAVCGDHLREDGLIRLENTVDKLRERFGHFCIQKALMLTDTRLTGLNPKDDHLIYPLSYF